MLTSKGGPTLRLTDSLVLQETDTAYLGRPTDGFTVANDGYIYVPDMFARRLFRYHPSGKLDLVIGTPGAGPGEFGSIVAGTLVMDALIVQATSRRLQAYDRLSGSYRFTLGTTGYMQQAVMANDTVYLALYDYATQHGVLRLSSTDLRARAAYAASEPLSANLAPAPRAYVEFPEIITFAGTTIAVWGDTLVVGFGGTDLLRVLSTGGRELGTFSVPRARRRGIPQGAYESFLPGRVDFKEHVEAISNLRVLYRMPSGLLLVMFTDGWTETVGAEQEPFAKAWIALVDLEKGRACVETELPFPGSDKPRIAMRGDTLYALDQVERTDVDPLRDDGVVPLIRRYVVESGRCEWLPMELQGAEL